MHALLAGAMAASAPARAYPDGPWCLKANVGAGVVTERCHFGTFEACSAERGVWGSSAFCVQNPRYPALLAGPRAPSTSRERVRSKKHRHDKPGSLVN